MQIAQPRRGYWLGLVLGLAAPLPAAAQTASQITPKSFVPPSPPPVGAGPPPVGGSAVQAPDGADRLFVTLAEVDVANGLPALAAAEAALRARLIGKRIAVAEAFAAAHDLETAYARAGYVLVRVVVPKQHLADGGSLRLIVVDGFIERIDVQAVPKSQRARVAHLLMPLKGKRGVTLRAIERRIELASDVPGLGLRSALSPGEAPGSAVLVISAQYQPIEASLGVDNALGSALGRVQLSAGLSANGVFGAGELVYVRISGLPNSGDNAFVAHYARNRALAGGIVLPIGDNGLTANAEAVVARTTPASAAGIGSTDAFERFSVRVRYPWLRSRALTLSTTATFDAEDERQSLLAGGAALPLSDDRLRVFRLAVEVARQSARGGSVSAALTLSQGIDALGARPAAAATVLLPLSRQGADAAFTKLEASASYSRALASRFSVSLTGHAQTSFGGALLHAEQFGIAGPGLLSGFDSGSLLGDGGAVVRGQIGLPLAVPTPVGFGLVAEPYVFGAGGVIALADPTALERRRTSAEACGVGVNLAGRAGLRASASLSLEFARQFRDDGVVAGNRFTVASTLHF